MLRGVTDAPIRILFKMKVYESIYERYNSL